MYSDTVVLAKNLSKEYKLYNSPADRLIEAMPFMNKRHELFHALNDVSFSLKKGEAIGIIGKNGAGKSTLLQLICGTVSPSSGSVEIHGRIAALLELGAGFNPEFTGRENVWMNAAILGMSEAEIAERFDEIVAFSEIGYAIDHPVKTYSSGMFLRLAFSVAVHVSPDVLVIDEALSVGDGAFAKKSFDKIMALKQQGCTLLFCSHSLYQVEALCQKAIWIKDGQLEAAGEVKTVSSLYQTWLDKSGAPKAESAIENSDQPIEQSSQNTHRIVNVTLCKNNEETVPLEEATLTLQSEQDDLNVLVSVSMSPNIEAPSVAFVIETPGGTQVCSFSSQIDEISLSHEKTVITLTIPKIPLLKGEYIVDAFLLCEKGIHVYEHLRNVGRFLVSQTHLEVGVIHLNRTWSFPK